MSGNAQPQFTRNGNVQSVAVTAANTSSEGGGTIGTNIFQAFLADATNGSFVDFLRFMPTASATTTTTATIGRVFVSSQSGTSATTSANTWCIGEVVLPAVSADSSSAALSPIDFPLGFRLPAGYTILVTNYVIPQTNTQWQCTVFGGDY
jgi:hypothetical protein